MLGPRDRKKVGMGSMLGSGEAKKLDPENTESIVSSSCGCSSLISRSSCSWSLVRLSASDSAARVFLWISQRSAEEARLGERLLLSHLLHKEARPGIPLLPRLDEDEDEDDVVLLLLPNFFLMSQRSTEDARPGLELPHDDEDGLPGALSFLCASHLSDESARPGLGLPAAKEDGRMMRHGAIVLLGGVGSRPGRSAAAALAIARSTDVIDDLLDYRSQPQACSEERVLLAGRGTQVRDG
jgi:hypothetical protein